MKLPVLAFLVPLAACSPGGSDPAAGGVSAGEAQALNDAAAALDDNGSDAVIVTNTPDETTGNAR